MVQGLTWTPGFGEGTELNDKFAGAGMVDTIAGLVKAANTQDEGAIAAYSVGLAFDVVGAVLNPLGAVIGAGVGWLIDHIAFLREPLDLLMGDNIAIRQETEKLKEDAQKYEGIASSHLDALKKLDGWNGEAADRFRASMAQVAKEIEAIGSAVNASAKLMGTMGACVTAVRALVRDIIAMVIGNLIGGALIAAGLAPFTFGASIVAFVGVAVATAVEALARILRHITSLKSVLSSSAKSTDDLGTALVKMSDEAARFGRGGGSSGVTTPPPVRGPAGDTPTPSGGAGAGGAKPPAGDAPPVQKPPAVDGGGSAAGGAKPPAGDAPPTPKPPEAGGGSGSGAGGGRTDTPETPPVSTAPKPDEAAPKPPAGDAGAPKPPGSETPAVPKPDEAAPKPPFSWTEVKSHVDDLGKYSKEHLEKILTTKFDKTPDEAADISRWIKNFEELAAPGGQFKTAGGAFASGTSLHLVHELWKELAADQHSQNGDSGFLSDLKEYNAEH